MHPHLPRPVDRIVLLVLDRDTLLQLLVADGTFRRFPAARLIECRRGKLAAELNQLGANRLDPESRLVLLDELNDQRSGRSSSAAKKIDAAFKISLARFNSRFSARSRRFSADSSLVTPGRTPESTCAFRIQFCKVCAEPIPSFWATDSTAAQSDG